LKGAIIGVRAGGLGVWLTRCGAEGSVLKALTGSGGMAGNCPKRDCSTAVRIALHGFALRASVGGWLVLLDRYPLLKS